MKTGLLPALGFIWLSSWQRGGDRTHRKKGSELHGLLIGCWALRGSKLVPLSPLSALLDIPSSALCSRGPSGKGRHQLLLLLPYRAAAINHGHHTDGGASLSRRSWCAHVPKGYPSGRTTSRFIFLAFNPTLVSVDSSRRLKIRSSKTKGTQGYTPCIVLYSTYSRQQVG